MRRMSLIILFLVAIGPSNGPATASAEGQPVTEDLFLAAVDTAHPASRALRRELGAAEAHQIRVSVLEDPKLLITREAPEVVGSETTWALAWTPPIDGRRKGARRVAEAGVEVETHRLDGRLSELRLEVRETYAAWAVSEARESLLADHGSRLEALTGRMRSRAEAGEESPLAARRVEIAFNSSRAAMSEARAEAAGRREGAAAWILDNASGLSGMSPQLPGLPEVTAEIDPADAENRPDVREAHSKVERAESLERLSRRAIEAPEFLLGWMSIENVVPNGGSDFEGPVFAIGWKVPVFDRKQADRLEAEVELDSAMASRDWTIRRARSELAAALVAYVELRKAALLSQSDLEGLVGVGQAATASFAAGESTVTDLLDTLRSLLDARLVALDLYDAALGAHRELELAAGRALDAGDQP